MKEMKDSGIEWIGKIPQNWGKTPLLYLLRSKISDGPHETPDLVNDGIPFISVDSLNESENIDFSIVKKFISEEDYEKYMQKAKLEKGDILFTKAATIGKTAIVKDEKFMVWSPLAIIKTNPELCDNKYIYYVLNCRNLIVYVSMLGSYNTQINVGMRELEKAIIPFPPLIEQCSIANYLDSKCSEIDSITADIESQIEKLEQYKRSVITEAVTKGLNTNVEMKNSGIEWVGDIPASWNIHPVYYYFGERKNRNRRGLETNLLSLSYGNIIRKDINTNEGLLPESFNTYNIVEPGDIIIRSTDLQNDKRSLRTGLVKEHGIITSAYIALRANRPLNPAYFHYLLHAFDVMKVFYNMGNGVRQGLNYSEFSKMMIIEPPIAEQNAIVEYLNDKCSEINSMITDSKKELDMLAEYKKSLIYEYVTGKKEAPVS